MSQPDLRLRGLRLRVGDEVSELDLSKYEGHTEGPWFVREVHPGRSNTPKFQVAPTAERGTFAVAELVRGTRPIREREQNARLIADAPLLLAEVRRLREENAELIEGNTELRRPFSEWMREQEDMAVAAAKRGDHFFIQSPDGEDDAACLRCLRYHPDAGQGCIEYMRQKYIKSQQQLAALRKRVEDEFQIAQQERRRADEILARAEKAEAESLAARNLGQAHLDRAEKAERERDILMDQRYKAIAMEHEWSGKVAELEEVQADLDAALDWIAEGWSNAKPESWARTLALLEKRRADTLRSLRGPGEVGA